MSYFDDASLVMIPSGYKTSKVYSVKPTDGSGDLTFSRSNDTATRVNSAGLIEKVRTNVFPYSQDLSNAAWQVISNGGPVTKTANAGTAPDGTNTASRVQITGGGTYTVVAQSGVNPLGIVTISGYFKRYGSTDQVFRLFANNGSATANLTATDTWQRFSFTVNASSTGADGFANDTSNNPCDILVWGMQLETGDIATDYISTTSAAVSVGPVANVPRLDYLNSSCPRLLLEPQRTNVLFYSEQFNNAWWTGSGSIVANTAVSPSGYQDADTGGNVYPSAGVGDATVVNTASIFAKANPSGESTLVLGLNRYGFGDYIACTFNLATGTAGTVTTGGTASGASAKIEDYGNGWYRCSITGTPSTTAGTLSFNPQNTCFIWGAQIEAGAYATSYIPTLGAAVTRGADACSKTGISSLIGQTEGTLFLEMNINKRVNLGGSGPNGLEIKDASGNNVIMIGTAYDTNQVFSVSRRNSGSFSTVLSTTNNALGTYKLAAAYSSAGFVFYVNGVQIGTTATLPPSATYADMGLMQVFGTNNSQGELVNQALVFKTRLTNAQLAELTTL